MQVQVDLDDLWFIVDAFWNTYGCGLPDPRTVSLKELKSYGIKESEIPEYVAIWDDRYLRHKKWALRLQREERKESPCFGGHGSHPFSCRGCSYASDCAQIRKIIDSNGCRPREEHNES